MQVTITLTADDLLDYNRQILARSPLVRRAQWKFRLAGAFLFLAVAAVLLLKSEPPSSPDKPWDLPPPAAARYIMPALMTIFAVIFVAWHIAYCRKTPQRLTRQWRKLNESHLTTQSVIALTPQRLVCISADSEMRFGWRLVGEFEVSSSFVAFPTWFGNIIVPRRFFADDATFTRFVAQAREFKRSSPESVPKCPRCGYDLRGAAESGCSECGWKRDDPGVPGPDGANHTMKNP